MELSSVCVLNVFVNANAYYFNPTGIQLELSISCFGGVLSHLKTELDKPYICLHQFGGKILYRLSHYTHHYILSLAMKSSEPSITRKFLKARLLRDYHTFRGFTSERTHVKDLLLRTVETGESNSALIVGPRGSGKTTVGGQEEGLMQSVQLIVTLIACS